LAENGREIQMPANARSIEVEGDGTISADGSQVARLRVVRFDQPPPKEGLTLHTANGPARPVTEPIVVSGALESSNVNAVHGVNELITITRSFEAFQKVIDAFRDLDQRTARDVASSRG
jgi:flagellar basal-body rod protein FlgG